MAMYEANLEELAKEDLVNMVKMYRKKEKMWKVGALRIVKTDDEITQPIPSKSEVKMKLELDSPTKGKKPPSSPEQSRPASGRTTNRGQEHMKRHSAANLTNKIRHNSITLSCTHPLIL
jgi:hypothetical protein